MMIFGWTVPLTKRKMRWIVYRMHNISCLCFVAMVLMHVSVWFAVSTQQPDVQNGVLFDEWVSSSTLEPCDPSLARRALSQQLLHQPRSPHFTLLHRRHVLPSGPTQELWIWACATFSRICLYQWGGHDWVGKMIVHFRESSSKITDVCVWKAEQIKQQPPIFNLITENVFEWKGHCVRDVIGVVSVYSVSCQWNSFQSQSLCECKKAVSQLCLSLPFLIYLYKHYRPVLPFTVQKFCSLT